MGGGSLYAEQAQQARTNGLEARLAAVTLARQIDMHLIGNPAGVKAAALALQNP